MTTVTPRFRCFSVRTQTPATSFAHRAASGKSRWRAKGRGKRGGSRVIYYWHIAEDHIYLLTLYGKGVKDDLTPAERAAWRKVVEEIKNG